MVPFFGDRSGLVLSSALPAILTEGSDGQSKSPTDFPLLLLRNRESGALHFGRTLNWDPASTTVAIVVDTPPGSYSGWLLVNAAPSMARTLAVVGKPPGDPCGVPSECASAQCSGGVCLTTCEAANCVRPSFTSSGSTTAECERPYLYDEDGKPTVAGGGPLLFRLEGVGGAPLPAGLAMDPQLGSLTWTPTREQRGSYALELWADGPGGSAWERLDIQVSCEELPPTPAAAPRRYQVGCACDASPGPPLLLLLLLLAWAHRRAAVAPAPRRR